MSELIGFIIEKTLINTIAIFLAISVFAFIAGAFLKKVGANNYVRTGIYTVVGIIAGLSSYSAFDIPERSIEALEALSLSVGIIICCLIVVLPIVLFKNREKKP